MRSIDDIIDKLDTSSVDRDPDGSQTPTVTSSAEQPADAGDEGTLRANTVTDGRRRGVSSMLRTEVKLHTAAVTDDRQPTVGSGTFPLPTSDDLTLDRPHLTSESTVLPDTEPLWKMFGAPLSQLCRRLLTDSEQRPAMVAKTESMESRRTDILRGKTEHTTTTQVPKNVGVESQRVSDSVQPLNSSRVGVVRSNGQASHVKGHKPPLPAKPSLPPKPPIAKKPSFSKDTSAGVVRKPSSLSSPACSSSSSVTQQRHTRSTSSQQCGSSSADGPPTTSNSAPTSPTQPTVGIIQRDAGHQQNQQQQQVAARGTTSSVMTTGKTNTPPTNVTDKTKRATTGNAADRRSPARDRMKTTKSEEFLARIHRRSVSPVGTPRLMARGTRGKSVDLTAATDTSLSVGRRTLSKEWAVVTTTTQEEVTVVYRPPATSSTPEIVRADAPAVTSSTSGVVKGQGTVNNNVVDNSGGRLYKTAIDNIRLSVGDSSTTNHPTAVSGDGDNVSCQLPGVRSVSGDTDCVHGVGGRESANNACQLDDLISSLMEMAVDVEGAQPLQPPSMRHGVISTAHY